MKYLVYLFPLALMIACNKDQPPTGPTTPTLFYLD